MTTSPDFPESCDCVLTSRELGGGEMLAVKIAKTMKRQNAQCRVWLPGSGPASQELDRANIPWFALNMESNASSSFQRLSGSLSLTRAWLKKAQVLHIHSPLMYRLLYFAIKAIGIPTVVHMHIEQDASSIRWAFQNPPDVIVPCSQYIAKQVRVALAGRTDKIRVCPILNAIDDSIFFPGSKSESKRLLQAPSDRPLLLVMANLSPHKGQPTAIRIVRKLWDSGLDVDCWITGSQRGGGTSYLQELKSLALQMGVSDRVQFLGHRTDNADLVRAADFLLLPSSHEGLPLSILEAQASKTLVLASPIAGVPEVVVDDDTGYLIAVNDVDAYANRIAFLVSHPQTYADIAERAFLRIKAKHTWSTYCRSIASVYRAAIAGRSSDEI
jgi:glycosyltransferase involved in cell wall biosynthesis